MIELFVLLGVGGVAYYDYRNGFSLFKSLSGRAEKIYLRLSGVKSLGPVDRARQAVTLQEARVEKLRKSVASIGAAAQVAYEESQQQLLLAQRFQRVKDEAIVQKDLESAETAGLGELEALKRADVQRQFSERHGNAAQELERRLLQQEQELLLMKDQKSTIEVRVQISDGLNNLYQLLVDVEAETGVESPRLLLEQELKNSRQEELTASNLIALTEKRKKLQGKILPQTSTSSLEEIQKEINGLQKRIAIPEKTGDAVN